jgi:predicted amidohydrolase
MTASFRAAAVQMNSREDVSANLAAAVRRVEEAAGRGARLVVLPEMFPCLGRVEAMLAAAEVVPGPIADTLAALAQRLGISLLAGSMAERGPGGKAYNTSLLFGPQGTLLARYRKRHLFDVELPGVACRESSWLAPGDRVAAAATDCAQVGLAICYDLRFPEHFRALADGGAEVLLVPSAFTLATGRDHWEVLLRARAIENQAFVVAANQWGEHPPQPPTYGRSTIIDPWGTPLATAADGEGLIVADLDFDRLAAIRRRLPALAHRLPS